ncbi:MAG: DUF4434 domain-containing protein, partial [Clostridia bacterium]|nr:DUF4434 domain-containing protein [Clostridia bacterium]
NNMKKVVLTILLSAFTVPFLVCCADRGLTESKANESTEDNSIIQDISSENSEETQTPYRTDLSVGSFYNYSNINSCTVYGDDGGKLTDGFGDGCNVIINDIDGTFGDWYGKTHTTSLFAEKSPYFYIENDFGFPSLLETSSIVFGEDGILPECVEVFYSNDGYNYSFYAGMAERENEHGVFTYNFPSPVLAKSVKYVIYAPLGKIINPTAIHNIGTPTAIRVSLAEGAAYTIEGDVPEAYSKYADDGIILTDGEQGNKRIETGKFIACESTGKDILMDRDVISIKLDLGDIKNVSEVYLSAASAESVSIYEPEFISVKYSVDGLNFSDFSMSFNMGSIQKQNYIKSSYRAMRNHTVEARYITVNIYTSKTVMLDEITVYGATMPVAEPVYVYPEISDYSDLAIIRGGFYGFFIDYIEGYNYHHYYDEYRTYIQLKGFRELGMDTVIIGGESLNYEKKITLAEPPAELTAKGYRKGVGHGVYDLNEAILTAADKLGMNIYLSTVASLSYSELKGTTADKHTYIDSVLADAKIIIRHMYDKYSSHPSFYGFYLVDETCDYWLMQEKQARTTLTRKLYKGQSDVIRSLDDNIMISIAPAAWRNDTPKGFGESLYNLIKNDEEGLRPIVDYVFVQDCLGRFDTISVPAGMYGTYASYLAECKAGVEKANAIFGNDIEIFDVCYRIKRYDEIKSSLELETPYTEHNLVYDLTHYFSATGRGSINKYAFFDNDYVYLQYVKHLNELRYDQ